MVSKRSSPSSSPECVLLLFGYRWLSAWLLLPSPTCLSASDQGPEKSSGEKIPHGPMDHKGIFSRTPWHETYPNHRNPTPAEQEKSIAITLSEVTVIEADRPTRILNSRTDGQGTNQCDASDECQPDHEVVPCHPSLEPTSVHTCLMPSSRFHHNPCNPEPCMRNNTII